MFIRTSSNSNENTFEDFLEILKHSCFVESHVFESLPFFIPLLFGRKVKEMKVVSLMSSFVSIQFIYNAEHNLTGYTHNLHSSCMREPESFYLELLALQ